MEITLPKALDEFVKEQVASGLYGSPEEVHREGIRLLKARKESETLKLERLRLELSAGIDQLDCGEGVPFDVDDIVSLGKSKRNP